MKTIIGLFSVSALTAGALANVTVYTDAASFLAALGGVATVDNFEGAPWVGGSNTNPTTSLGVTWSTPEDLFITTAGFQSPSQSLSAVDTSANPLDLLRADLGGGIFAAGAYLNNFAQGDTLTATIYDATGGALGSASTSTSATEFIGFISTDAIAAFEATSNGSGGDDFWLDDFHFSTVPAPGAAALLGLGGLVATRRRR